MGQAPDEQQLTYDIEQSRRDLTRDVDALHDRVSPSRVVERRVQRTRSGVQRMRESVMGSAHHGADSTRESAHSTATTVKEKAEGSPLAAGLIAFGAGWLISSLLPASDKEAHAAEKMEDMAREHGQPVAREAQHAGQEVGQAMKEKATQAGQELKSSAQESAQHVRDEGQSSAQTVKDDARPSSGSGM